MSEATIEAAPETVSSSPQEPLTAPIPAELQALMERVLPVAGDAPAAGAAEDGRSKMEDGGEADGTGAGKVEKPVEKPVPKEKTEFRLAPDLSPRKPEGEKEPAPEVEITEEMVAAEKNPKKQADLRKLGAALERLKLENTQLKAAPVAAAKADEPGANEIIEQQTRQIADLSARLERQNLQEHPIFQERFIQPRQRMMSEALEVVKQTGGDPDALEWAMSLTGKNRIGALDDIVKDIDSTVMRSKLERLIDGIETKDGEIAAALKDSKGLSDNLNRQEKINRHETLQRQEQQLKSLLGAATRNLADNLKLEVLQKVDNRPEHKWWNDQVDDITSTAEEILLKATPEKMATAAVLAASAGALQSLLQAERAARKAAEQRLAEIEDAEPTLGDRGKPRPANGSSEFAPDEDITKVAMARLRRGDFNGK